MFKKDLKELLIVLSNFLIFLSNFFNHNHIKIKIKKIFKLTGIDGAVAYTALSKFVQAVGGLITILVMSNNLTNVEQGYYYTFGSILAIQIFFELGLSNIISQFVAHENSHLQWENSLLITPPNDSTSRLSHLLRFTLKWFSLIALFLFFTLLYSGFYFFTNFGNQYQGIVWHIPWIMMSLMTSLSFIVSPILAYLEGLGKVKDVAVIKLLQQFIQLILTITFFSIGFRLYSLPFALTISFLVIPIWLFKSSIYQILLNIWHKKSYIKVNYFKEIFPYQWKIALSWISGYFIFQIFNPVLFATEGAKIAGQMGMTLAVLNSIYSLCFSWITTKISILSTYIAKKDFINLDILFNKTLFVSSLLNAGLLVIFFVCLVFIRENNIKINGKVFAERFLSYIPLIFMIIPIFLNHIVGSLATYMRCFKKEPMLLQSIVSGILCSLSTVILGNYFGLIGITSGYLIVTIIGFIWTLFIYRKFKLNNLN